MPTLAGQIVQAATAPGPEWRLCDGSNIQPAAMWLNDECGGLNPNDYYRRVGGQNGQLGIAGWLVGLPNIPAAGGNPWWVSLADNPTAL